MNVFDAETPWGKCKPAGFERWLINACHRLPKRPLFFYTLNKGLRRSLKSGKRRAFDVEVLNLKLRLINHGNYCETTALLAPQFYDAEELAWLESYLSAGDVFLDIGGNIGLYSLVAANSIKGLHVYTVEPDPTLSQRMSFNANTNQLHIHHCNNALSDYLGQGQLATDARQSGENTLESTDTESPTPSGMTVEVTTLQALCESLGVESIQMMKIDIEGHEHRVLSHFIDNAPTSLWPQRIIIEHVHDKDNVIPLLTGAGGYQIVKQTKRNTLLSRV